MLEVQTLHTFFSKCVKFTNKVCGELSFSKGTSTTHTIESQGVASWWPCWRIRGRHSPMPKTMAYINTFFNKCVQFTNKVCGELSFSKGTNITHNIDSGHSPTKTQRQRPCHTSTHKSTYLSTLCNHGCVNGSLSLCKLNVHLIATLIKNMLV